MHQAVETEKLEASENVAGGPVVQNHHMMRSSFYLDQLFFFYHVGRWSSMGHSILFCHLLCQKYRAPSHF